MSLENALAKTESDADASVKAAASVVSSLKKLRAAAQVGNLRELPKAIQATEQAISTLRQQFTNAKEGWDFDEEAYLSGRAFPSEVIEAAKQMGVKIFEQDERLYCYPFLIRVLPNERAILINKTREKRLRPSVLAKHLRDLQNKPVRFRSEAFLESLWLAYTTAVAKRGKAHPVTLIPLLEIYALLTLLPGQSKEYPLQEFARDIYLLDQSKITRTKKEFGVRFPPASTATRTQGKAITVIAQDGREKKYYGISFTQE